MRQPDPPRLLPLPSGARIEAPPAPGTLAETVDHLIARGLVLQGEVAIAVAGTDLVRLDLSAVLRAVVRPNATAVPRDCRDTP
jgi:hypothetical protein